MRQSCRFVINGNEKSVGCCYWYVPFERRWDGNVFRQNPTGALSSLMVMKKKWKSTGIQRGLLQWCNAEKGQCGVGTRDVSSLLVMIKSATLCYCSAEFGIGGCMAPLVHEAQMCRFFINGNEKKCKNT